MSRRTTKKSETRGNDGWIPALVHWAAETYHWSFEDIMWRVPLSALALLKRRERVDEEGRMTIFPLSEVEKEDDAKESHS